jgi:hypothetical protein
MGGEEHPRPSRLRVEAQGMGNHGSRQPWAQDPWTLALGWWSGWSSVFLMKHLRKMTFE